jgi:hypothetical protein
MEQVKIINSPNISETLRNMTVGVKMIALKTKLSIGAVRSTATRLKDEGLAFTIEDESLSNKFYITRLQ